MIPILLTLVAAAAAALIAFLCGMETAFFSLSRQKLRHMARRGAPGAASVLETAMDPDRYVTTTLVGINFGHALFGSIVTFLLLGFMSAERAQTAAVLLVTPFVLVVCELFPKALFRRHPHGLALRFARPFAWVERALLPLTAPVAVAIRAIMAEVSRGHRREEEALDEIRALVRAGGRAGSLEDDEARLTEAALRFARMRVRAAMVPRMEVAWIDAGASYAEALARFADTGYERLLVCEASADRPVGTIHFLDLVAAGVEGFDLRRTMQAAVFVPASMRAGAALAEIRRRRARMAVVVDEFGGTAGIATAADLAEEIFGVFDAAGGAEDVRIVEMTEGLWTVDARIPLAEVREACGFDPGRTSAETLGGWVTERHGGIPSRGVRVDDGAFEATVVAADARAVRRVMLRRRPPG